MRKEAKQKCALRGIDLRRTSDLEYLLSSNEKIYLQEYNSQWSQVVGTDPARDRTAIYHLHDNPLKRRVWSGATKALPTLRKATGILWVPSLRRFLTKKDSASVGRGARCLLCVLLHVPFSCFALCCLIVRVGHARAGRTEELMLAMGFPSYKKVRKAMGIKVNSIRHIDPGMVGNGMHVASVGLILGVALVCTAPR